MRFVFLIGYICLRADGGASADVKVAASGVRRLRNRAFIGGNASEDGEMGRNWVILQTIRTMHYCGLVFGGRRNATAVAPPRNSLTKEGGYTISLCKE